MNHSKRHGPARFRSRPRSVRRPSVWDQLGERLESSTGWSNAELIRLMRREYFADVDALGPVKLPE
jgi:hypothetical protein